MINMANIVDFNNSDGIPPDVIKKLNNNMFELAQKITIPEIVMTAGIEFPEPRTDETMFYKTDTGDVYIWGLANQSLPGEQRSDKEQWVKVDLGNIRIEQGPPPTVGDQRTDYQLTNEILWFSIDEKTLYILMEPERSSWNPNPVYGWYSLYEVLFYNMLAFMEAQTMSGRPFDEGVEGACSRMTSFKWLDMSGFVDAVKAIHNDPNSY